MRAVLDEGTEAKVIHECMIVRSQRLVKQTGTVTDKDVWLTDDARMGREHDDVAKGFKPLQKLLGTMDSLTEPTGDRCGD
jgi:hypothetical protein